LILTFQAIAGASKFDWKTISCDAVGKLERVEKITQFTNFSFKVILEIPQGANEDRARRLLDKAEQQCLITNSLKAPTSMDAEIRVTGEAV